MKKNGRAKASKRKANKPPTQVEIYISDPEIAAMFEKELGKLCKKTGATYSRRVLKAPPVLQ